MESLPHILFFSPSPRDEFCKEHETLSSYSLENGTKVVYKQKPVDKISQENPITVEIIIHPSAQDLANQNQNQVFFFFLN